MRRCSTPLSRRLARPHGDDAGFALVATVLVLAVLSSFSLVMLKQVVDDAQASHRDQDWGAALSAAQAGVDEYLSRLNQTDGGYYVYNDASPDTSNPAMGYVSPGKPKWATLTGVAGTSRASFHYDVDTTRYTGAATITANGTIKVTSTGRVGVRTRTLQVDVRRSGFLDYLYFTDFETQDPLDYPAAYQATAKTSCGSPKYAPARASGCTLITFSNDVLNGPVHSNDLINICSGVTFQKSVTTWAAGRTGPPTSRSINSDGTPCSTSGTTFSRAGDPALVAKVTMPSTNALLKAQTAATASPRGCLYVGPTSVVLKGNQVKVTSPWTKTVTPGCTVGAYMSLPVNGVIFVDDVPPDGGTDVNSWPSSGGGGKPSCSSGSGSTGGNTLGYPISGEASWTYPCRLGDVFVQEEGGLAANALDGRLTLGAANNVYVTNHIDYAGGTGGRSLLGLIARQFVYVWHPVDSSGANLPLPGQTTPFTNARISASLLSVDHAVTVMNYARGADLGMLNITGSLTQRYRGIVRQGLSGYAKNYVYDRRLAYDSPPHFLDPTSSFFRKAQTTELAPAYRAG